MTQTPALATPPTPVPPQIRFSVLYIAALGFALWALGWFVLIPSHESQLGWILEFVGPLLIAVAIIMYVQSLAARIGKLAVFLAAAAAVSGALSTVFFAIDPAALETIDGVRFGYGAYGVALLLGSFSLAVVLVRKEAHMTAAPAHTYPLCPVGCPCGVVTHASFGAIALGAAGLLVWGIGFLALCTEPEGTRFGWSLAVVGSLAVTSGLAAHFAHLSARFGRWAIISGVASAIIWSLGYLLEAIDPAAGPLSSWYTDLFICYGVGHLLTALSLLLVARRKRFLES
jgi:hypothetical protein